MKYNHQIHKLLNKAFDNFKKDKNISKEQEQLLHFFFIDEYNKGIFLKEFFNQKNIPDIVQLFPKFRNSILIISFFTLFIFTITSFILSEKFSIPKEILIGAYCILLPFLLLGIYVEEHCHIYNCDCHKIKNVDKRFEEYTNNGKNHIIKLMLFKFNENEINKVLYYYYRELYNFYTNINNLPYKFKDAKEYSTYMLKTYHTDLENYKEDYIFGIAYNNFVHNYTAINPGFSRNNIEQNCH